MVCVQLSFITRIHTHLSLSFRNYWPLLIPLSLTLLSVLSWLLSIDVIGPFDARTGEPLVGTELAMPLETQLLEPFMSISHLAFGSPNFRMAILSMACWTFALVFIIVLYRGRHLNRLRRYFRSMVVAVVAVWLLLNYILFVMVHHIPGWTLETPDEQSIIADFHSHTDASHDGLVSINQNLQWHQQAGFDLSTISDHWGVDRRLYEVKSDDQLDLPAVIIGVEIDNENKNFILGLGLNSPDAIPEQFPRDTTQFVDLVHNQHQGAVTAMTWLLKADRVEQLIDLGIDGIEIVNNGHPYIDDETRQKVLDVSRERGIPLIGSTDWHGWTGYTRVWTIFSHKDLPQTTRSNRGDLVVNELRNHNRDAFVPVVAGTVGGDSVLREMLTPFYEWGRYAMELSPQRILFWWIWTGLFTLLYIRQRAVLLNGLLYGLPVVLSASTAIRGFGLDQKAEQYPQEFFIRELPGQLYTSVILTIIGLLAIYLLNRKREQ